MNSVVKSSETNNKFSQIISQFSVIVRRPKPVGVREQFEPRAVPRITLALHYDLK